MRKTLCLTILMTLAAQSLPAQQAVPEAPDLTLPTSPAAPILVPILVLGAMALFVTAAQD